MRESILAVLLGLIDEQEQERNKGEFIRVRTVAVAGGAHSPVVAASASTSALIPPILLTLEATGGELVPGVPVLGTGTIRQSGNSVIGTGTAFLSEVDIGDTITASGISGTVTNVADNTHLTLDSSVSFPVRSVLDDFNRSNTGPPPSTNWTKSRLGTIGAGDFKVVSNAAKGQGINNYIEDYWNVGTFGPDCEAYLTLTTTNAPGDGSFQGFWVALRLSNPTSSSIAGYYVLFITNGSTANKVQLYRYDNDSSPTQIGSDLSTTINAGDSFGASIVGSTITAYRKPSGGSWGAIGSWTEATYSGAGYISMGAFESGANLYVFDNYGGGKLNVSYVINPPATYNPITIAATFDQAVTAINYSSGVTVKVNSVSKTLTSATRQTNHAIVYYVLPSEGYTDSDVFTWEYAMGSGTIAAEDDGALLESVTAQVVTNSITGDDFMIATVILTDDQIKALPSTPVELIAAPGAGKAILPIAAVLISSWDGAPYNSTSITDSGNYLGVGTGNDSQELMSMVINDSDASDASFGQFFHSLGLGIVYMHPNHSGGAQVTWTNKAYLIPSVDNIEDTPITIFVYNGAGDFTGGDPANTLKVTVFYQIIDL